MQYFLYDYFLFKHTSIVPSRYDTIILLQVHATIHVLQYLITVITCHFNNAIDNCGTEFYRTGFLGPFRLWIRCLNIYSKMKLKKSSKSSCIYANKVQLAPKSPRDTIESKSLKLGEVTFPFLKTYYPFQLYIYIIYIIFTCYSYSIFQIISAIILPTTGYHIIKSDSSMRKVYLLAADTAVTTIFDYDEIILQTNKYRQCDFFDLLQ